MSGLFGGGNARKARAQNEKAMKQQSRTVARQEATARRQEQQGNEGEMRARQRAERGGAGRGRNMMEGRLSAVMPSNLGGV